MCSNYKTNYQVLVKYFFTRRFKAIPRQLADDPRKNYQQAYVSIKLN